MFAIFKILSHSLEFEFSNLEFVEKTQNLKNYSNKNLYHINKYKLLNEGWCFIMKMKNEESFAEFLLIEIDSDKVKRKDLISIIRDIKLQEILN